MLGNRKATVGAVILLVMAFVAAFPGLIAPDDPQAAIYAQNAGPSSAHLLGTTQLGQDVFSQLIWSTRLTLLVTLIVTAIATFLSTIIGVTSAYVGGVTDRVLTVDHRRVPDPARAPAADPAGGLPPARSHLADDRAVHHQLGVPGPPAALAGAVDPQPRLPRSRPGRAGSAAIYIILVEIVPTMTSLIAASFLSLAVYVVGFAASLQFLGLGNSSELMWGTMLYNAQQASALEAGNAWWALAPGAAVALLGAGFALLNYAFDEIGNPALAAGEEAAWPSLCLKSTT